MQLGNLIGKLVLFKFSEEIKEDLPLFQIFKDELWAVVTNIEDIGIWIENPAYELGIWWDKDGQLIPPSAQKIEKIKTDILIPWRFINGLMSADDERFQKIKNERMPGFKSYK
jgi:hypothetical protein